MNDTTSRDLHESQARLAKDLKTIVRDAEELLRHAVKDAGQGYGEARSRLEESLNSAKAELASAEQAVIDGVYEAGRAADRYVHRHPWESIGIGAGIGLLVGLLIGRR